MIRPMNSRDVMPKNVPGVGWVMKSTSWWDGVGWVMVVETLWGSLLVDMRPWGCFNSVLI